jgi:hypothetical protein
LISAGKVLKVKTFKPARVAAWVKISPELIIPSPPSPPIRIVRSSLVDNKNLLVFKKK